MKAKYYSALAFCISIWIVAVFPAFACTGSDVQEAKDLMAVGHYKQAVALLAACADESVPDAEVYFQLGKGYLYQGGIKQAESQFQQAVKIDKNYRSTIGENYKAVGMVRLNKGKTREAGLLFAKAIEYQRELKPAIVETCFAKGAETFKRAYFDLAISLDAAYQSKTFNFLMDRANKASNAASIGLYKLAVAYCGDTCNLIKTAGKRLTRLMDEVEKRNPLDAKIASYKDLADHFVDTPPDFKLFEPGIYPFKLSKGSVTKWIRCKGQGETTYEFRSDNQKYEVYLRSGKVYRAWAGDSFPESVNSDVKIKALEDTVIFLTLRR